jgi:hypothetical protein
MLALTAGAKDEAIIGKLAGRDQAQLQQALLHGGYRLLEGKDF